MLQCPFLTYKTLAKYFKNNFIPLKGCLLLFGFIFLFGVANAGSIDVHKVKGNAENNTLPVEYALLGTDYAVTDFVTYANSASEVPPVIRKYSSYFGFVYTMGRIGGSLYSSAKLATAEEAAFAESAAKASTSEITTEETATATTVTSTEEKVTATSTEETAPTTPAKETTASEGTTTGTTTKENVPVETKTTVINDGSVAKGAESVLGSIVKNGNKVEYTNQAGKLLKWSEQDVNDIDNAITSAKSSTNLGKQVEGKVGEYVKSKKEVTAFGQKVKRGNSTDAGDIDVLTKDELIECKASIAAIEDELQFNKYTNSSVDDFLNPYNKKVILYIDAPMGALSPNQTILINTIKGKGVTVVNSLSELGGALK